MMIYGKSGVYLPLALLALLIPAKQFGGKRTRLLHPVPLSASGTGDS
ncbi:MAG: hypothetical protein V8Q27_02410 [Eubacteriales bacterium]